MKETLITFNDLWIPVAIALGIVVVTAIAALISTFFMVQQRTARIVQRLGRFVHEAKPDRNIKIPFIDMDVMNLVLMTQYFDTLKDVGAASRTNTILIPHSPGSLANLSEQIRNAMIEAGQAVESSRFHSEPKHATPGHGA